MRDGQLHFDSSSCFKNLCVRKKCDDYISSRAFAIRPRTFPLKGSHLTQVDLTLVVSFKIHVLNKVAGTRTNLVKKDCGTDG